MRSLRDLLIGVLPPEVASDPMRLEALDLLTSFEAWTRLRLDQGLSTDQARRVLQAAVSRLAEA